MKQAVALAAFCSLMVITTSCTMQRHRGNQTGKTRYCRKIVCFDNGGYQNVYFENSSGEKEGPSIVHDRAGNIESVVYFRNGELNGPSNVRNPGKLLRSGAFSNGKRSGIFTWRTITTSTIATGEYVKGKEWQGTFIDYHPWGAIWCGDCTGSRLCYQQANYEEGVRHGQTLWFKDVKIDASALLAKGVYNRGVPWHGRFVDSLSEYLYSITGYSDGIPTGEASFFAPMYCGLMKSDVFENEVPTWKVEKLCQGSFKDGKKWEGKFFIQSTEGKDTYSLVLFKEGSAIKSQPFSIHLPMKKKDWEAFLARFGEKK